MGHFYVLQLMTFHEEVKVGLSHPTPGLSHLTPGPRDCVCVYVYSYVVVVVVVVIKLYLIFL